MSETIKEAVKGYWLQGLAVVPVKAKQPLTSWAKWQTQPQSEEEVEALPWTEADGFGVLCGLKAKNGLYFAVIDVDKSDFDLSLLRTTAIEKTPGGGYHFIYWSRQPVKPIKRTDVGLELLGLGNICIMAPSKGYIKVNDNVPTEIDNAEALFNQLLAKLGVQPKTWFSQEKAVEGYRGPDPPCIKALIGGVPEGLRNETAIRLASYLVNFRGLNRSKALAKLRAWNQRNKPPLPSKELEAILKSAETHGYIFGCEDELLRAHCNRESCSLIKGPKKVIRTPSAELPDGRLIEQAYDGNDVYFLVYNLATGLVEKQKEVEAEGIIYRPIKSSDVKNGLTLLPSDAVEYESEEKLFQEVIEFMNRWHQAPNEFERKLDAFYVFLTYVFDLLPRLPYRRALGPWGRGKSAWLDTVGCVSYRPIILAGCDTDKAIVRRINTWKGTALIDEADFDKSTLYAFIIKILNIGYDRRLGHYTRADDINPQKTISYNVFGPKLLANREEFKDTALESRCLTFVARDKDKPMPLYRDKVFLAEAQALRNKLILWRFRKYHELKQKAEILETPELEKELNVSSSRIKEVIAPLLLLNPAFKFEINTLAHELENQIKASDPDWQLEEAFKDAVLRICEGDGDVRDLGEQVGGAVKPSGLLSFVETEPQKVVLRIPLVKIAKVILDSPNPDPDELKGLNKRLAKIARTRLGLKIITRGGHKHRLVEIPYPPPYKTSPKSQTSPLTSIRVIELDDKHPAERAEPTEFVVTEEEAKAKEAEEERAEGRVSLRLFRITGFAYLAAKVFDALAWKAVEFLHRRNRDLPMDLTFPDGTKWKVRGPITWDLARLKAKEQNLTRESTLPGCIGIGQPIPPNQCETCQGDLSCFDLPDFRAKLEKQFRKIIKVRKGLKYADVNVYLCETKYRLTPAGQRAFWRLVTGYIEEHEDNKHIGRQFFGIADDWASFTIIKADASRVIDAILEILLTKGNVYPTDNPRLKAYYSRCFRFEVLTESESERAVSPSASAPQKTAKNGGET